MLVQLPPRPPPHFQQMKQMHTHVQGMNVIKQEQLLSKDTLFFILSNVEVISKL